VAAAGPVGVPKRWSGNGGVGAVEAGPDAGTVPGKGGVGTVEAWSGKGGATPVGDVGTGSVPRSGRGKAWVPKGAACSGVGQPGSVGVGWFWSGICWFPSEPDHRR
jgi:hypothetical protein